MKRMLPICLMICLLSCGKAENEVLVVDQEAIFRGQPAGFWIEELKSEDPTRRSQAVEALYEMSAFHGAVVIELSEVLSGDDDRQRKEAAELLGKIGGDARPAIPALNAMRQDANEELREAAVGALRQIDPDGTNAP